VLEVAGGGALCGILVLFGFTNEYQAFLYPGGMLLCALLSALLIVVTVHPGARLSRLLGVGPLRWVGKRSYGIYLWSYPVIVLTTPLNRSPGPARSVIDVVASLLIAALSWRYLEDPIRHGALGRIWARVRAQDLSLRHVRPVGWTVASLVVANGVVCVVGLSGLVAAPALDPATTITAILPSTVHHPPPTTTTAPFIGPTLPVPHNTSTPRPAPAGQGVTAIGDSIMIDAAPYLRQLLPGVVIDARVGQQLYQVQENVNKLRAEGAVGDRLILELGTNGAYSPGALVQLLRSLGPMRRIVLVNVHVARPWEQEVNQTIAAVAKTYPHVTVLDWYAIGYHHPGWFYPDGVHLNPEGARAYAALIVHALEAPPHGASKTTTHQSTLHRRRPAARDLS